MADTSSATSPLDPAKLCAVREELSQIRIDLVQLFEKRLDRAREIRNRIQQALTVLRLNDCLEFRDEPAMENQRLPQAPVWMEDAPQAPFEQTLRLADEILDEKDAEISRLKTRLQEFESNQNAQQALLSNDEIEAERAKLQQLQDEWREKMRQSEVEVSLERARLTREREQLTEKLCRLESEIERLNPKAGEKGGRKWLRQLGLNSD